MLMLKLQAYEGLGAVNWTLSVRDLDAGADDPGVLILTGGRTPESPTLDSEDQIMLVARQALDDLLESHHPRHR